MGMWKEWTDAQGRLVGCAPPLISKYVYESFVNSIRKTRIFLTFTETTQSHQGRRFACQKGEERITWWSRRIQRSKRMTENQQVHNPYFQIVTRKFKFTYINVVKSIDNQKKVGLRTLYKLPSAPTEQPSSRYPILPTMAAIPHALKRAARRPISFAKARKNWRSARVVTTAKKCVKIPIIMRSSSVGSLEMSTRV